MDINSIILFAFLLFAIAGFVYLRDVTHYGLADRRPR